jgi:hypothetical protein
LTTKDRCVSRYTWQSYKWTNDICVFLDLNQRRRCLSRISKSCIDRSILVAGSHMKLAPAMVDTVAFLVQIWGDMEYLLDLPHMIASLFLLVSGNGLLLFWRLSEEVLYFSSYPGIWIAVPQPTQRCMNGEGWNWDNLQHTILECG